MVNRTDELSRLSVSSDPKASTCTDLGYLRLCCRSCRRTSNERTGTPFHFLEMPTFRLLFKLSLRDLVPMFLIRGYKFSQETVRDGETRFAPLLADPVRRRRKNKVGRFWYVDETYRKVNGVWCYLYRAIDREGQLVVDSMLSTKRDRAAAQRFFRRAQTVAGRRPAQVATDGHASYPRALAEVLGQRGKHRCSRYKNHRIEADYKRVQNLGEIVYALFYEQQRTAFDQHSALLPPTPAALVRPRGA